MKITKIIQNLLFLLTIFNCEAKEDADKQLEDLVLETFQIKDQLDSLLGKPKNIQCSDNSFCTNVEEYKMDPMLVDVAKCNNTSNLCTNYCFVRNKCTSDIDCNYSLGEKKRCRSECYRPNNETIGRCLIISKKEERCDRDFLVCEEGLECDYYYTNRCISRDEIESQTGEPLFSLFLFMLIMLSLFNRQRADEDLLNNMGPNELLMVSLPSSRRRPQEEDVLPVYRPINDDSNEDELIEQNIPELNHPEENQEGENDEQVIMVGDEDDLPLLPPSYDEAINSYVEEDNNNSNTNSNININGNTNSSSS